MDMHPVSAAIVLFTALVALWSSFVAGGAFVVAELPESSHRRSRIRFGATLRLISAIVMTGVSLWLTAKMQ